MPDTPSLQRSWLRRPRSVTFLSLFVLICSGFYLTRVFVILRSWSFWEEQYLPYASYYLLVTGLVWGLIFLGLAAGLWFGKKGAGRILRAVTLVYLGYYWIERIFLSRNTPTTSNWPFLLGITLATLALIYWLLSRPAARQYLGEDTHER